MSLEVDADIVTYLAAAGLGLTAGTNLFKGMMPEASDVDGDGVTDTADVPALCVSVLATGGPPPEGFMGGDRRTFRMARCQVRVRGPREDPDAAKNLARNCYDALIHAPVSGYVAVRCRESGPVFMGVEQERSIYVFNISAEYVNTP